LNGKEADKNGLFTTNGAKGPGPGLFLVASEDINCRCTTYYKLKGFEQDYTPDWTYKEWKREYDAWKQLSPKEQVKKL